MMQIKNFKMEPEKRITVSKDKATYTSQIEMSSNVTPYFIQKIKATKTN